MSQAVQKIPTNLQEVLRKLPTTSSRIRYLDSLKLDRKEISLILNIRYQHVRNILITPVKNQKV